MNSTNNYAFTAMEVETRRQLADLPWEVGTARLLVSELDREMTLIVEAFLQSVQTLRVKDQQLKEEKEVANAEKATIREEANRRLEAVNTEKTTIREEADRRLEAANAEIAEATRRHQDVMGELQSTRIELQSEIQFTRDTLQRQIAKLERLLRWKSITSTRNPAHENLTHKFIISAGRKLGIFAPPTTSGRRHAG
ncbi:hypothetical protein PF010_g3502 [Phytophthora fragariae]|uniref:Uncharacterized protein n=1 Tax=Phytophthora fragariae TaxID=53985 RepID=A0A6G0LV28_9STRA|nr:hypothetical protein PF010_g3502 [Phytophthora fragariae]KAE9249330.1 hypothetical protein PF004_g3442 [Phytophthora fragariae]